MIHLEDLPIFDFLNVIKNIDTFNITQKYDGSSLWMGVDEHGLFTSREGKRRGIKRFYTVQEYPLTSAYNWSRSAHAALKEKEQDIKRVLQSGQMVELEIIFGNQPNAITYGANNKSYIIFIRGVNGTPDVILDQIMMNLEDSSVIVSIPIIKTSDGETLTTETESITYQFTRVEHIPVEKLKDVKLNKHLKELEQFLEKSAEINGLDWTNFDLIKNSIGSIPIEFRPDAKQKKEEVLILITTKFKLPIKQELLQNFVKKIKPSLVKNDITADEYGEIEGVVLRNPVTDVQVKIVDKDNFTILNAFNYAIRNQISNVIKSLDSTAPLEARGGIIGDLKIKIADLLGNKDLARGYTAKQVFNTARGKNTEETIKNLATNLEIQDFLGTKRKLLALISQSIINLKNLLNDFKEHKDDFQLALKTGQVLGISSEVENRTLLVFAESTKNLLDLLIKIKRTKSISQIIAILYGHLVKSILKVPSDITESLLFEKKQNNKNKYLKKDAFTLLNIYIGIVLMAVIIYMVNDNIGIRLLKDRAHSRLSSWNKDMSELNFWGYPIWHASSAAVKKLIGARNANEIFKISRIAQTAGPRNLHQDLSFGRETPIDWSEHRKTIKYLQRFDGLNTDRINNMINGIFNFNNLNLTEKSKTLSKLFYYVTQYIPSSTLFTRLKIAQNNLTGENETTMTELKLLSSINALIENEVTPDTPVSTTSISSLTTATHANDTNTKDSNLLQRVIVKRKRNPNMKWIKFRRPKKEKDE